MFDAICAMKKRLGLLVMCAALAVAAGAEEVVLYTVFLNVAPEGFNGPLIGFVNIGRGSHTAPQLGFVNLNGGAFSSLQGGFVNRVGSDTAGAQAGFVNTTAGALRGVQAGFVNVTSADAEGVQAGFVNHASGGVRGYQAGFANVTGGAVRGAQGGFVNIAPEGITGAQAGYLNITRKLRGLQLGFINYADTLEEGLPIGFLSILRHGGYRAIEASSTANTQGVNGQAAFKIGVERFYTSFIASFGSHGFGGGVGMGTIISLSASWFVNPELDGVTSRGYKRHVETLTALIGYKAAPRLAIVLGPSLVRLDDRIDGTHTFRPGAKAGLRYQL
jgi:hypothetical protein